MTTSTMLGTFRENLATRTEFLDNISRSAEPLHF
jgi:GTP cyclohydrolase IA